MQSSAVNERRLTFAETRDCFRTKMESESKSNAETERVGERRNGWNTRRLIQRCNAEAG